MKKTANIAQCSLVAVAVSQCLMGAASAATITVTTTADSGAGSLRAALASAADGDTIAFSLPAGSKITLLSPLVPPSNKAITIRGNLANGKPTIAIDGGGAKMLFDVRHPDFPAPVPATSVNLTLDSLLLQNANGYATGVAAVYCQAPVATPSSVTLVSTSVTDSSSESGNIIVAGCNVTMKDSTVSGTDSRAPFKVDATGALNLVNSTISGNRGGPAGAIQAVSGSAVNIFNSTIASNLGRYGQNYFGNDYGAAIYATGSSIKITNSIIAGNTGGFPTLKPGTAQCVLKNTSTSGSHNFIEDSSCLGTASTGTLSLGVLADNGGPTKTMKLGAGSAAIDAGSNAEVPAGLASDQRSTGYVRVYNSLVDIGAYEAQPTLTTTSIVEVSPSPVAPGGSYTVSGRVAVLPATDAPASGNLPGMVTVTGDGQGCSATGLTPGAIAGLYDFSCSITAGSPGSYTIKASYADDSSPRVYWDSEDPYGSQEVTEPPPAVDCEGFFAPVDKPPTMNRANAGRTIPLKWRCTNNGVPVTTQPSDFRVTAEACSAPAASSTLLDAIEEYSSGKSGLISQSNGSWQFNWATPKSYANSCRTVVVTFSGVRISADFRFVR